MRGWAVPGLVVLLAVLAHRGASSSGGDVRSGAADPSTVISDGGAIESPLRFLRVGGPGWASEGGAKGLDPVAAYHVVLLFPSASITALSSGSGGDADHHVVDERWRADDGGRAVDLAFRAEYDAEWGTVTIAGVPYSLSDGNVFVVRLEDGAEPGVRQIDASVAGMGDLDAVRDAAAILRDDPELLREMRRLPRARPARTARAPTSPGGAE